MINVIKQEIIFDKSLKKRLEFICEFSHTTSTFIEVFIIRQIKLLKILKMIIILERTR